MKKISLSLFLVAFSLISFQTLAQFPGGGGGGFGGGMRGPGMGGQRGNDQKEKTFIPGTADDDRPRGNGKISGLLMDSTSSQPVEYATIALIDTKTNKPIDGTTADGKGKFTLSKLAPGTYKLQYSFLGYSNKTSAPINIVKGSDINVGVVKLSQDVRTLGEVTVTGQAALIEEKVDRLVYNAEKDITSKGGDATDIMRKVPMLSVDLDGNVSLRGSSNVRVLINNKPSTIVATSVADALKQIPADMIKSVEVITSPSAKYDAEGSAGIINIVTKKNTLQGATMNVDMGTGNRSSNLNLNASYRQGKMGFNLGGFGRAMYNIKGAFNSTQSTVGQVGTTTTIQSADTRQRGMFGNYQLGWDYDIDKNTSLTATVRYGLRNMTNFQDNLQTLSYLNLLASMSGRNVATKNTSGTVDANVSYTKTYKPNQELSVLGLYSRNNNTNNFVAELLNGTDMHTITGRQRNDNLSSNQESTLQIDYQTPIKKNQLLEFGGKGIFRNVNSDYKYFIAVGDNENYQNSPNQQANTLNYDQNITAGYVAYTYASKTKWTLKAGGRYEYTFINAHFNQTEQGSDLSTIPNYGVFVPSVNVSKSIKGGKIVKLGYNRRIQRPGIQFLNPNVNVSNPLNISQGNPFLKPELTDNFELGLSGQVKKFYLNATLFARVTNNSITSVRDTVTRNTGSVVNPVYQQVISSSFQNIGKEQAYGVNLFTNVTLFSIWQMGGGIDLYHTYLTNNNASAVYGASNSGWVIGGRLFTSVTLKNGWGLQGFGGGRGRQINLQGYQGSFAFYNLGVKKDFNNKRGSIGIGAENFFNHPFKVRSESKSPILTQSSVNSMYNAGVRVNFSYRLGKMSLDGSGFSLRRKKSINNDDQKGGGDDNGGGQQQQQSQPAGGGAGGGRPRQK
ncbi:TonB-dependent receptor domain-containing protein [Larkinella terrae]|uniref:TonB-dependent receptor n=1 Tax=Larkinella terrae TaxID=2025311 RepID=A0A7K0EKU0_9BACT|nr:outer membrane beta-barrel family protein [Larkinella terrae]MRS62395.1 TonB-dependent receptor [Larkinella terrae]